uniref:Uncharacterized protein n=1 Tax=Salix viminalis TaxID=40686 RepID=A0A6N2NMA1_SALVM
MARDINGRPVLKQKTGNWKACSFILGMIIGMCTLTLSASIPVLKPPECTGSCASNSCSVWDILFGLYLIALGTGGIKPCVSSFGRISLMTLILWKDKAGWGLGFGIPALFMGVAIATFFSGTPLYRFQRPAGGPVTRMCQVMVASFRKRNLKVPQDSSLLYETQEKHSTIDGSWRPAHGNELKCLDKAAIKSEAEIKSGDFTDPWRLCTVTQVEELKILIRMFPIWATGIVFFAVQAQMSTIFVNRMLMTRKIGSFNIPPASMTSVDVISVIFWVPIYDMIIVPVARKFTGRERGFSDLQRMGIGLFISMLSMTAAALLEIKRLQLVKELGLVDDAGAVPLSIFWQIPQYTLIGTAEIFTAIGQIEFFYEQSPDSMRSLCSALGLLTTSLGDYLSSFILSTVTYFTTRVRQMIPDNLNMGHLDYLFWLLAGLSFFNLLIYTVSAMRYKEKKTPTGFLHILLYIISFQGITASLSGCFLVEIMDRNCFAFPRSGKGSCGETQDEVIAANLGGASVEFCEMVFAGGDETAKFGAADSDTLSEMILPGGYESGIV